MLTMQTNLETINAIISRGKSLLQGLILALPLAESQHLPSESSQLQLSLQFSANALIYDASQNTTGRAGQLPKLFSILKKII